MFLKFILEGKEFLKSIYSFTCFDISTLSQFSNFHAKLIEKIQLNQQLAIQSE